MKRRFVRWLKVTEVRLQLLWLKYEGWNLDRKRNRVGLSLRFLLWIGRGVNNDRWGWFYLRLGGLVMFLRMVKLIVTLWVGSFIALLTQEKRLVADFRSASGHLTVNTTRVYDGFKPYETGIKHNCYNEGKWIIVEAYFTRQEAKEGHNRWIKTLTAKVLPPGLKEVQNSDTALFLKASGCQIYFPYTMSREEAVSEQTV